MRNELLEFLKKGMVGLKEMSDKQAECMNGYKYFVVNDFVRVQYTEDCDADGKFLWVEIMLSERLNGEYDDVNEQYAIDINDDVESFVDIIIKKILVKKIFLSDAILFEIDPENRYDLFGGDFEDKYRYCQVLAVSNVGDDYKTFPFSVKVKLYNNPISENVNDCVASVIKEHILS